MSGRKIVAAFALTAIMAFAVHTAWAASTVKAKLAHTLSSTSHYQVGAEKFKELVESRTKGAVEIEIYPAAQLGGERDLFEGLSLGTIEFSIGTSAVLGQTFQITTDVFAMPWLYSSSEQFYTFMDSDLAKKIYSPLLNRGLEVLVCYGSGFRQLSNNVRPVNSLADVKGLKIRCPEAAIYINTFEAIGISPTPLSWTEVFSGLQTGVIDGQETPMSVFLSDNLGEVQKHFAFTNYMIDPIIFAVSSRFLSGLTPEQQKIVRDCAYEAAVHERQFIADLEKRGVAIMEEKYGVKVTRPDPAPFQQAVRPLYDNYRDQQLLKEVMDFLAKNK